MKLLVIFLFPCMLGTSAGAAIGSKQCPNACFVNPCTYTLCADGYQCVPDCCDGCNANCVPIEPASENVCPPGVPLVYCDVDPCWAMLCGPGYVCMSDYCGGCTGSCVKQDFLV